VQTSVAPQSQEVEMVYSFSISQCDVNLDLFQIPGRTLLQRRCDVKARYVLPVFVLIVYCFEQVLRGRSEFVEKSWLILLLLSQWWRAISNFFGI
jgi:hypothetical protein